MPLPMEKSPANLPLTSCPFCGQDYTASARFAVKGEKDQELVHVTCFGCGKAMVMATTRTPTRLRSVGVMTDCNAHDYKHFSRSHRVTLDDVLRVHQGLRK